MGLEIVAWAIGAGASLGIVAALMAGRQGW